MNRDSNDHRTPRAGSSSRVQPVSRGRSEVRSRVAYARAVFEAPLVRNTYSLVGSTLATSLLGVAFWIIAARRFTAVEVGVDSALISTMTFLANVAQLNLTNGFNRFVPTAGHRTHRLVVVGYGVTVALAAVAAVIFLAGAGLWAPSLAFVAHNPQMACWFVAATMLWTIFALEDAVLTGLGEAHWVLVENIVYGILKLVVLVVIAGTVSRFGLFAAWTVPLIIPVVAVNVLLFRRLIPRRDHAPLEELDTRTITRLVGVDFIATLLTTATLGIMPLVVLAVSGARANAYVALAWTIAYPLHLISLNAGMAMITEASRAPQRLIEFTRNAIGHALRIVVPLVGVVVVSAPFVLRIFGPAYSANATRPLQLFAVAAIPNIFMITYISVARVQRRMWLAVGLTLTHSVLTLGLMVPLLHLFGVTGVGLAWLISTSAIAIGLLVDGLRSIWLPHVRPASFRSTMANAHAGRSRRESTAATEIARHTLEQAGLTAAGWSPEPYVRVADGTSVIGVHSTDTGQRAVLRVALNDDAGEGLRREVSALETVRLAMPATWRPVVPFVIACDTDAPRPWALESRCDGQDARRALADPPRLERLLDEVATRVGELYRASAQHVEVDDAQLARLVEAPIAATEALPRPHGMLAATPDLGAIRRELTDALLGRELTMSLAHGDLWLGSVVWQPATNEVTGIVDWRRARVGPPVVDLAHLACTTRALQERRELGDVVREVLHADRWRPAEERRIAAAPGFSELSPRTIVLLAWLRHVYDKSERGNRFRAHDLWRTHNVQRVLENL
jgi:O-antigen/teichoic acid export membrane protein/aminoglycoside phosphotransferase (APT) family kinase protein